jgi:hypothetical protein
MKTLKQILVDILRRGPLKEEITVGRAHMKLVHRRDGKIIGEDENWNLITYPGRDFLHNQCYGTTSLGSNGLNYIALSNDTVGETTASTTLSNEITTNGLARAQGTVAHSANASTTTIDHTFTASGSQSAQKAALFTASSSGTMNHVLAFTQRSLIAGDTLQIVFTITLS